ncbi:hypothetical protein BDW59DRAFT_147888 [Aspergillus cavernicola]|uniref:N-acetyltransferase domain-containing protein n=1 Tax=Aspergillus cavernicola TaxID=176166 RepID=A0ABR4I8Q2_9EURO
MSGTDESDVIVLPKRGGREAHNTPAQRAPTACKIPHEHFSKTQEPLPESAGSKVVRNTDERRVSQVSVQFSEDVHKGVAIPSDHELKEPTTTTEKENRRETAAEELARLRKEIVFNAHRGRFDDSPTASPEELTRCRDGPGTDRQSEAYHEIATLRLVSQDGIGDESYVGYSLVFTEAAQDADPEVLKADLESQMKLSRELYKKSPTAFPIRQDDEALILSPVPTEKHKKMLAKVRKSLAGIKSESTSDSKEKQPVQMLEKSWSDPIIVDWEYCPRCIDNEKPYRVWFQGWLESTIERKCVMDIFHQAFFNGTAHADGETSMFMLDMRNYVTQLGPTDKKARLHAHETAAGYCYNILLQNGKAEEAEEHRKRMERQRRVEYRHYEPLRSPSSPRANIYLRPVDINKDVPELRSIYNWYAQKSVSSPNTVSLDAGQVRQQIEICLNARLPFIVAVDRRSASNKHGGRILGYACAREFDGLHLASQFTAEMELYVRDGNMNQGIGKCLLDKLLEVCDSTYTPKGGYLFEATKDDRSAYYPGGRRKLARLIFTLCYVDCTEISGHKRVKKWLQEHAEFEEQGLLRGVRVKNNKL